MLGDGGILRRHWGMIGALNNIGEMLGDID